MTHEEQQFHDGLIGKDMEAYYKLDASLHPEIYPRRLIAAAVTQTTEYQRLTGLAVDAQLGIDKWHDAMKLIANARDRLKGAAEPDSLPKFDDAQQQLLQAAAHVLGPFIGKAAGMKRMHQVEVDRLRGEMRKLELGGPPAPESERWMKHAADAIGEKLAAMKGQAT